MPDNKFKFGELKDKIKALKERLPAELANQAQNYFVKSWASQGYDNKPWQDVKRHDKSTNEYKYPIKLRARKLSSPILVGVYKGRSGGTLRRKVSNSIRSKTFKSVKLQVDLKYAAAQNEGTGNIPARPFMKKSPILSEMHREKINQFMSDLWK